jgi:hypothetical protein
MTMPIGRAQLVFTANRRRWMDAGQDRGELTTPGHVAVTPYYGAAQSVAEQIASLSGLKYEQTIIGEVKGTLLGAEAAMRTFTADLDGTFRGVSIPKRVFVTSIMVRQDGQWRESFYQVTALKP